MRKGKLSTQEKYAIQGMLHDNKDIEEMSTVLDRSTNAIRKYLEGELASIYEDVKNVRAKQIIDNTPIEEESQIPTPVTTNPLPSTKDLYIRKTQGGKPGVAIQTHESSERGDMKPPTKTSRVIRKSTLILKTGEPLHDQKEVETKKKN